MSPVQLAAVLGAVVLLASMVSVEPGITVALALDVSLEEANDLAYRLGLVHVRAVSSQEASR